MLGAELAVVRVPELATLEAGREAVCFAALAQKSKGTTKYGSPYWKCHFQDRHARRDFMIWADDPLLDQVEAWGDGRVFRLRVRAKSGQRGIELKVVEVREATAADSAEGYDVANLYEVSRYDADECSQAIRRIARDHIADPKVHELVVRILDDHDSAFRAMPAATSMHHAFTGGLLEHVRSMARICAYLGGHYARYYDDLNPPLNRDVVVAAGILHDIGKLFELEYHPVAARYTTVGNLVGHIILGRDLVRKTAESIADFPAETLLQIEHAILAHHGKREFGAPVLPQTIEAMIVSFADELDAKINQAARCRVRSQTDEPFTDEIFQGPDRRRIYKGVPVAPRLAISEAVDEGLGDGATTP